MSSTTFVGQNWGAGQTGRAREGVRTATVMSLISTAVLGVAVLCWFRRMECMTTGRKPPENRKE